TTMSAPLVVLLPILLLGIVIVFCFVGCVVLYNFDDYKAAGFTVYSGLTVLGNPAIVAGYWPLDEALDTAEAVDHAPNPVNGKYVDQKTVDLVYKSPPLPAVPAIYPWPLVASIPNPPGVDIQSADAPGTLTLGQAGLVKGDAKQPPNNSAIITTCMVVN